MAVINRITARTTKALWLPRASTLKLYHLSSVLFQYKGKVKHSTEEIDVPNNNPQTTNNILPNGNSDTSLLPNVLVTEATAFQKPKAAESYFSTSILYDETVNKFVNCMMYDGKKSASINVMRETFEKIKKIQIEKHRKADDKTQVEISPLTIFHKALENAMPVLGTQTMKKKGKNYQVPYPLPESRRRFLAIKWFLTVSRNRPGNDIPMSDKLCKELLDAYRNDGAVIQKKKDFHKKAELQRAFAHYRWW